YRGRGWIPTARGDVAEVLPKFSEMVREAGRDRVSIEIIGWSAHSSGVTRESGRSGGARDANLEKAALESCPQNLYEGQRPRSVAGPARDGEFPGGDRRTPR